MTSADWALQEAIHSALIGDGSVLKLLSGPHVYDDVPRGVGYPYVTFGQSTLSDWSTMTDTGSEHVVSLHVWSQSAGRKETLAVMQALRAALHDKALTVAGHQLINLRHEFSEARRDVDGESFRGLVRLRGRTQPLAQVNPA